MRLNLGCGRSMLPDFVNVDISGADINHDLCITPWPFETGCAEWVNASHVIEHLDKLDAYRFLRECYRVMSDNALITLAVPDLDKFIEAHLSGDFTLLGQYEWTDLNALMGGGQKEPNQHNRHRQMYCYESLAYMLGACGFCGARESEFNPQVDNPHYARISLYMEARKCMTS